MNRQASAPPQHCDWGDQWSGDEQAHVLGGKHPFREGTDAGTGRGFFEAIVTSVLQAAGPAPRLRASVHVSSVATIVIFALSSFDTGQPVFVLFAISWNCVSTAPGIRADTMRWLATIS